MQRSLAHAIETIGGGISQVCGRRHGIRDICRTNTELFGEDSNTKLRQSCRNKIKYWEKLLHGKGSAYIDILDAAWQIFCAEATRNQVPKEVHIHQDSQEVEESFEVDFSGGSTSEVGRSHLTTSRATGGDNNQVFGSSIQRTSLSFQGFAHSGVSREQSIPMPTMSRNIGTYRDAKTQSQKEVTVQGLSRKLHSILSSVLLIMYID